MVKQKAKGKPPVRNESTDSMLEEESPSEQQSDLDEAGISSNAEEDDGFEEPESKRTAGHASAKHTPAVTTEARKRKKPKQKEKVVQPPTLEEMKELRDTQNLFHSNLFKLQVKEMLSELQLKPKYINYIESWLETFKTLVLQMDQSLLDKCDLELPLNVGNLIQQRTFNFKFIKPTTPPQLIGAAAIGTLLGPKLMVDVCVEMPAECFQKEDYLNLVYDQKRSMYLACLASQMRATPAYKQYNFAFNFQANNPLKPVLELTPTGTKLGKTLQLRIFVSAPARAFKLSRFVPWNTNIRPIIFGDEWDESQVYPATQHYNANVLFDLTMAVNQSAITKIFDNRRNFQEGLLMLKVWLRQRQLDLGYSGFGAHILAAFIVYLYKQRLLYANSSSYQVARTVWNQLAKSDWTQGITLADSHPIELTTIRGYYDICFLDCTGYHNLCANVPLSVYRRVCDEAKLAVELLNDMKVNSFSHIFMQKCTLYSRMDHILKITKPSTVDQLLQLHGSPHTKYDYANYAYPQLLKLITELLLKGLSQRVHTILPLETSMESWHVDSKAPLIGRSLQLGLILNPEHAFEVLDKGPEPILETAEEFRKFWGEKCNLRRFQDGSIAESVVWAASTDAPSKKRLVVRDIVLHLLEHHLQLEPSDMQYIGTELDVAYSLTPAFKVANLKPKLPLDQLRDAESITPHVIRIYDDLARQLHRLNELPLEIVSIAGTSPVFRYCEAQPALPQARLIDDKLYANQVFSVVIQLGQSGKWPNELGALRALKTAFYIKIGELLQLHHKLHSRLTFDGLLVLKNGYCFQLQLAHSKELALLKEEINESGVTRYVDCEASRQLELNYYILPKVNGALTALHQTHGAYGPTVLIAKRWLGSQLLDNGLFPEIATELLVGSLFMQRYSPQPIATPQLGFLRLIKLLAYTDWNSELLMLNFNNSWTEVQISELEQSFRSERANFPPLCIATAYDMQHAGQLWSTFSCPNPQVLARATLLARSALQLIESTLLSQSLAVVKPSQLFRASNEGYDLIIQLKPDLVANTLCFDFGSPFVHFSQPNFRLPLACSIQVPQIVAQLRAAYSDFAAFFYNPYGGKELAVVWKPDNVFAPKDFKVNEVHACTPCLSKANKVQVLRETLLADFKFLLKDFYLRICTPNELKCEQRAPAKRYYNTEFPASKPKSRKTALHESNKQEKSGKKNLLKSATLKALN